MLQTHTVLRRRVASCSDIAGSIIIGADFSLFLRMQVLLFRPPFLAPEMDVDPFLPRDAKPWVCVCVCHKSEFCRNG